MSTNDPVPNDAKSSQTKNAEATVPDVPKRDWRFWLIFLSIAMSLFLTALELCSVGTALPVIVKDLHGSQFAWVGSGYALSATAFIPLSGGLAQAFGRRPVILWSLFFFALGSALCGVATSMDFLIAGRVVQGLGSGGIASLTQIIVSDLVPLHERGSFNGLIGIAWGLASGIGPIVGGSLAQRGQWRWLFYLNIPVCGVAASLVLVFLRLRTPQGTLRDKLSKMDWFGNLILISSLTSCIIGLTWGGIQAPWNSARVLVPLILGLVGLAAFIVYEAKVPEHPIVPFSLMSTRTGLSGYLQIFITLIIMLAIIYYMPAYYQACKGLSPTASGVDMFGTAYSVVPAGLVAGISVAMTQQYRYQLWLAWVLIVIGNGLLSTIHADSSRAASIGYQFITGVGVGTVTTTAYFPVLAPIHVTSNAKAVAFFTFLRNFASIWGVTIGGAILQNGLRSRLPASFQGQFPAGTAVAYAAIPLISGLDEPLKSEVRVAFAESIRVIWQVLIGIGGAGLLVSMGMKHLPLHTSLDRDWGLQDLDKDGKTKEIGLDTSESAFVHADTTNARSV